MKSINTIEGLLFRSYLTGYNLSLLHKCIKANDDDYRCEQFRKASFAGSDFQFERNISRAKELTERYLQYCERNEIKTVAYFEKDYPGSLLSIKDFPPLLFVKGNLPQTKCAAIVGTREPSPLANSKTDYIAMYFAGAGYGIISGLANGIDTLAHEIAIENNYYTAAVLPTALDKIYPSENIDLSDKILEAGGALITEQAPNYAPVANPFVLRNRIIAALSSYIIPVEMGKDSGTRHAIHYAVKYAKKLILCMPDTFEIDHFLSHYEGIIIAAKKYRKKENTNLILVRQLNTLPQLLKMEMQSNQSQLFK